MRSSSTSFSSCSVKLIRNCIPSLHLFSTTRQPTTMTPSKWSADLIESVCIEAFDLTEYGEVKRKQTYKM